MTTSGIEPATFRLVAQAVPQPTAPQRTRGINLQEAVFSTNVINFNLNTRRHLLEYLTAVRTLDLTLCTHFCSCGPAPQSEMVSRRRILSRSRDDLNLDSTYVMQEEEEDVWYQRDKLYKVRTTSALQLIGLATDATVCSEFYSSAKFILHVSGCTHAHHQEYNVQQYLQPLVQTIVSSQLLTPGVTCRPRWE